MKHKWGFLDTAVCPRCDCGIEDTKHVIRCNGKKSEELWTEKLNKVKIAMMDLDISPEMANAVCSHFEAWRSSEEIQDQIRDQTLKKAVNDQTRLTGER